MRKFSMIAAACFILIACNESTDQSATDADSTVSGSTATSTTPAPVEFADNKYMDMGKQGIQRLASGDIDAWSNQYAENAVYLYSNGDSLVGKAAINSYWKNRRQNVIDSLTFTNDIWLPIIVNEPQQPVVAKGTWLLGWYQFTAKYKTGKSVTGFIHTTMHYNSSDQVDRVIQYIDMAPIKAATGK